MTMATSVRRGLSGAVGRRRITATERWTLVQRGLDASRVSSRQAIGPSSARGYAVNAAAAGAATLSGGAVPSTAPRPCWRLEIANHNSDGRQLSTAMMFSTSTAGADAATGDAAEEPAVDGVGKEGGGGGAESEGGGGGAEAAGSLEENPLEGVVADDGDPGPPPPLDPSIVTGPSPKVLEVMEAIDSLNFVEMAMLIDVFKDKLGLDEVPTLNYGGGAGSGDDGDGDGMDVTAGTAKTIFKVKVTGFGDKAKIKVIKEVRAITGLGLREAKELVESLPQVVKEDLKEEEAQELKSKLEAAGATAELE